MMDLSLLVVSKNEEKNLPVLLESVRGLADEIVIVDSGSTDGTESIARKAGAKWLTREWDNFHGQKNFALSHCTRKWVLAADCDEALSDKLRKEIVRFLGDPGAAAGAEFPRCSRFLGRWIRHGEWYPDMSLRLFLRERGRFTGGAGHDRVVVDGPVVRLKGELLHYSYPTINSYIAKMNSFSDAFLEREIRRGRRWDPLGNLARPFWRFFRGYILKAGFLDGFPGFWIAIATAFAAFVRHSRLYEAELAARASAPGAGQGGAR